MRKRKFRVRHGSEHDKSDLANALHGLTLGLRALDGFDHGKQVNALLGLGMASVTAKAFSGMFGRKTGSGKYTEGVSFPCAANPDGSAKTTAKLGSKVIGVNVETKLPLWDYIPEGGNGSRVDSANSDRERRKCAARSANKAAKAQERNARNRAETLQAWSDVFHGRQPTSTTETRRIDRAFKKAGPKGRVALHSLKGLTEGVQALNGPAEAKPLDLNEDRPIVHAYKARQRAFIVEICEKK